MGKDPSDLHSGGRGIEAFVRPYGHRIAGEPMEMAFDCFGPAREFRLKFRSLSNVAGPTVVFVPHYQYPDGIEVEVSDGAWDLRWEEQTLLWHVEQEGRHSLKIRRK